MLHSNIVRLQLCQHTQTIKSSECLYYRVHFRVRKPHILDHFHFMGELQANACLLSIIQSFIQLNGMEWNRMQAILRPLRFKAVCQRWQTTAVRLHFLPLLSLGCVSICTEAPFIHQSSHFSQFILPLQVNKAEMTTTEKNIQTAFHQKKN